MKFFSRITGLCQYPKETKVAFPSVFLPLPLVPECAVPPWLHSVYKHILFLVPSTAALGVVSPGTGKAVHTLFKRTMSTTLNWNQGKG